jgi:cytochrome c biogenesis protein CcdA
MGILIIIYSLRPGSEPNNVLRCLSYLVSFSVGLGGVITALAITMVLFRERFARELEKRGRRGLLNFAPVFGAVVITVLGLALTYESFDANLKSLRSHILGAPTPPATGGNR